MSYELADSSLIRDNFLAFVKTVRYISNPLCTAYLLHVDVSCNSFHCSTLLDLNFCSPFQSKCLQNEDVAVNETYKALKHLKSSFISLKEAVKIGTLHETGTYGKALCLLSLNCVASEVTVGILK
jgi:hypothetical protein